MKIENSIWTRLIGKWKTSGLIVNEQAELSNQITGTDTYEFILDRSFILHKANVLMGGEQNETYELIQLEKSEKSVKMHYYNSNQESGIMNGSFINNELKFENEDLRFNGIISNDDKLITGKWQKRNENLTWVDFLEIKLSK